MYRFIVISAICFCTFTSCADTEILGSSDENSTNQSTYKNVEQPLWTYFQSFEQEAANRGIVLNLNKLNLRAGISEIAENGVLGQCQYNSHLPNTVTIDKTFWNRSSELYKEFVVFHELGHCVLSRDHREDKDSRGRCLSIMRSGLGDCLDSYNAVNRTYYLNELFDKGN